MEKKIIAIASENKAKIGAVRTVVEQLGWQAELVPVDAPSGVADQPMTLEETKQGAINRAHNALRGPADLAFGLEGGVYMMEDGLYLCNWGALTVAGGPTYTAAGAQIRLPRAISDELLRGQELGPVMDRYTKETGIRNQKGAVGVLTAGMVNREEMFVHIVKLLAGQYILDGASVATGPKPH